MFAYRNFKFVRKLFLIHHFSCMFRAELALANNIQRLVVIACARSCVTTKRCCKGARSGDMILAQGHSQKHSRHCKADARFLNV